MNTLPMAQSTTEEGEPLKKKTEAEQDYEDAVTHLSKDDIAQAANMFHNAFIGFEKDNDINGIAKASDRLGDICASRKDFDGAKKHYDRALEICQKAEDAFSIFEIDKKMADLNAICGNHKTAIELYQTCRSVNKKS